MDARTEIEKMLQKAEQSIEAADELLKNGYACFAVSRAYYAMFYSAEGLLLKQNLSFSKHGAVIAAFGEYFVLDEKVTVRLSALPPVSSTPSRLLAGLRSD